MRTALFRISLAFVLLLAACQGASSTSKEDPRLNQAQIEEQSDRQLFIDELVEEIGKPSNVTEIKYVAKRKARDGLTSSLAQTIPQEVSTKEDLERFGTIDVTAVIEVYPAAFDQELVSTRDDFIGILEHEYGHVEQILSGRIGPFPAALFRGESGEVDLYNFTKELDVYVEQLDRDPPPSETLKLEIEFTYLTIYTLLWLLQDDYDQPILSAVKTHFFQEWMLDLGSNFGPIVTRSFLSDGRETWGILDLFTEMDVLLTASEVGVIKERLYP